MKKGFENIDQLFKDGLTNLEADVNPSVWNNIEQGLQASGVDSSNAVKQHLRKINLKRIISFLILSGAVIIGIVYLSKNKTQAPQVNTSEKIAIQKATETNPASNQKTIPSANISQDIRKEKIRVENKQGNGSVDQTSLKTQVPVSGVDHSTENEKISNSSSSTTAVTDVKKKTDSPQANSSAKNNPEPSGNMTPENAVENRNELNSGAGSPVDVSTNAQPENTGAPESENSPTIKFYIPNTFTPNGDDINDVFTPIGLNFKSYELTIFDRFGIVVFRSEDIANSWDGKLSNGKEALNGIYLYKINAIDLNNKSHSYKGPVSLSR